MSSGRIQIVLRAPEGDQRDNPFAPPPEGAPDRPWQPRGQEGPGGATGPSGAGGSGSSGSGSGSGQGGEDHDGHNGQGHGGHGEQGHGGRPGHGDDRAPWAHGGPPDRGTPPPPPAWGSQWSSRQPQSGRPDPFARRPEGPQGTGPKFDPTDPAHRRSRYALVCGGWGLIFGLIGWTPVALLLGALALYWGISALRMSPEDRAKARADAASALAGADRGNRPAPPAPGPDAQRSFLTAAWTGIVVSSLTLAIVAATYAFQLAYRDYYTCRSDALTSPASHACQKLLPEPLRDLPAFRD